MIKYYFLAGALILIIAQAYYIDVKLTEIKALKQENTQLNEAQKTLYNTIQELEKRRELELKTLHELEQNKTKISNELDKIKDKIKQNPSGNIVIDFNKALDEIFKDNNYSF